MILKKNTHQTKKIAYKLSHNEVACKCSYDSCQVTIISDILLKAWTRLRMRLDRIIYVTNAFRCFFHNKDVGGADISHHMAGEAIDCAREGLTHLQGDRVLNDDEFAQIAKECGFTKVIFYPTFIHLDVRNNNLEVLA